jgi:hypothetical protein
MSITAVRFVLKHHPDGFDNFEVHGGQYCCPICFEAPFGFNNYEVHGEYSSPICLEAPSGFNNYEVHFRFCESFRESFRYFRNFS